MKLRGQTAFVTGAAGGIGRGIALALAAEGAAVTVCDLEEDGARSTVEKIRAAGGRAEAVCGDVSLWEDVDRMVRGAVTALGQIDVLVNCAGISRIRPFLDTTEDQWDRTIRVNLKSVFLTCRAALPSMIEQKRGVIINLSSQSGKRGSAWYADYCASKFGIIGLTQSLAQEFASDGIRVNAICPGIIQTGLWDEGMWTGYARKRKLDPGTVREDVAGSIPLGRLGTAEDVAKVAVFLASEDSSYMTGQAVNVTGGTLMD